MTFREGLCTCAAGMDGHGENRSRDTVSEFDINS